MDLFCYLIYLFYPICYLIYLSYLPLYQSEHITAYLSNTRMKNLLTLDIDARVGLEESQGHPLEEKVQVADQAVHVARRVLEQHVQGLNRLIEINR